MRAYLADDPAILDAAFQRRAKFLYGIRSGIVHRGSPDEVGAMMMGGIVITHYGERKNTFFSMEVELRELDELFLRALCRHLGIKVEPINRDLTELLNREFLHSHARTIGEVGLKLKGIKIQKY
jgi:hypothetical protein